MVMQRNAIAFPIIPFSPRSIVEAEVVALALVWTVQHKHSEHIVDREGYYGHTLHTVITPVLKTYQNSRAS